MIKNDNGIFRWVDDDDRHTSNKEVTVVRRGGLGLSSVLTIVFVVLKLCKVISWNWFWVLSPIIFTWGLILVIVIIALIIVGITAISNLIEN